MSEGARLAPARQPLTLASLWIKGLSFATIYRRLILLERTLDVPIADRTTSDRMDVSVLTGQDIETYLALRPNQDRAEIRARFADGQRCYAVWHEGRMIYAQWAAIGRARITYLASCLELAADEVYAYDAFAAPTARGHGASPLATFRTFQQCRDEGYCRVFGAVLPENKAPLRVCEKTGFRRIALIGSFGIGPWRRLFCRGSQVRVSRA